MLELPQVTLLCADTANHALALRALERSRQSMRFGRVAFLTDRLPDDLAAPPGIDIVRIDPLRSREDYSALMLKRLIEHVSTAHALVVQWDGYVVNPAAWDAAFLECDYLGAKWFWHTDGARVGNGGFSLRSRRLLEALADPRVVPGEAEDISIGRTFRPLLEREHGIRFGSETLADRFAFEAAYPIGMPFGFHGLFNFARVVPPDELARLAPGFSDDIARSLQLGQLLRNCAALAQWTAVAALAARRLQVLPNDAQAAQLLAQAQANAGRVAAAGRNEPCPCGSGKRYKQCHGAIAASAPGATIDPLALAQQGVEAHRRGDLAVAGRTYRAALAADADQPLALHYLGVIEYQRNRFDQALPLLERAAAAVPGEAEFHNNLGLALAAVDRVDEAIAAYRRAVALRQDHATAWNNLGLAYTAQNALTDADDAFRRAIAIDPGFAAAHWNRGIALLASARYAEGWPEYEWRLAVREFQDADIAPRAPRWQGQPLAGRCLLLRAEQGLGDTLHMVRFAARLADAGATVVARVPRILASLVRSVCGIAEVSAEDDPWRDCDFEIPIMSLAGALDVTTDTIPAVVPYIAADRAEHAAAEAAIRARAGGRRAIGLAWAGSPRHANDRRRSAPLGALAPLIARTDIAWFSLQHDDDAAIARAGGVAALHRIDPRTRFDGLAALIDALDLVIAVDTSVAHLAGAMAKPVWVLLPFAADWRWGVAGTRTAWYPTARLFRQPRIGDWASVVDAVARALDEQS